MSDCTIWTEGFRKNGYGKKNVGAASHMLAHRWTWEQAHGPIPGDLYVLHSCDVRACVNLEHLRLGTAQDNVDDMMKRGGFRHPNAIKPCCPTCSSEFSLRANGTRFCRPCKIAYNRRYRAGVAA